MKKNKILNEEWIWAKSIYNYMMKDPLLDWLKYHSGGKRTFTKKNKKYEKALRENVNKVGERKTYNFTEYIMEQGIIFEKKIMKILTKRFGENRIAEINGEEDPRNPEKFKETIKAMKDGIPIIHSGVLHNEENKTYGIPDLLVRSDWIKHIVNESPMREEEETIEAKKLGKKWHYRVIDIKFTCLLLKSNGVNLLNTASFPAYKSQLLIYNLALGKAQGYMADKVYILGRRWKYTTKGITYVKNECFDKLGVIDYSFCDSDYIGHTKKAIKWVREVRSEKAAKWNIMNYPLKKKELYPNMCNSHDYPWHAVKEEIAKNNKELTSLWMVGPKNRNLALKKGIYKWNDKRCNPEILGITGEKNSKILSKIIKINKNKNTRKISPNYIKNNIGGWKNSQKIEFFVDFETCNNIISNMKNLTRSILSCENESVSNFIFMIGVGYISPETNKWNYKDFTVNKITSEEEYRICKEFNDFILSQSKKYGILKPKCIHWSNAESIIWKNIMKRYNCLSLNMCLDWLDLLVIFKDEPIVINGCMSFSLKDVASTMKKHGFIKTSWNSTNDCSDGKCAMIGAIKANTFSSKYNIPMKNVPIIKQIINYNKVDVKVLYEILSYLRLNHISIKNNLKRKLTCNHESNKKKKIDRCFEGKNIIELNNMSNLDPTTGMEI